MGRTVIDALAAALRDLPPGTRVRVLTGPDLRGFLSEAGTWIEIRHLAVAVLAWRGRAGDPAGDRRRRALLRARLFDRVSLTRDLVALVPRGRIDAAFPSRCLRLASLRLEEAIFDLAALVLGLRLLRPRPGVTGLGLRFREDAEQGRPGDRIDLGTIAGPAGPLAIAFTKRRGMAGALRSPPRVRAGLRGSTLALRSDGARVVVLPAAGTRLIAPDLEPKRPRPRRPPGPPLRLVRREMIPGTSIVLAPVVLSHRSRLRVTREAGGLGRRMARALRIVRIAWPEAFHEIERRTRMVVPIRERGTVSYSMAARPGISYINVFGKTLVDLADDLLHETAHHRLHDLEETAALLVPGPETMEVQAFDSPWRGARRPLRGILHGAYTFLFRAGLFRRVLRVARRHPRTLAAEIGPAGRAFLFRELRRERRMIAAALRDLEAAARSGLLTHAGRRLLREMRARSAHLGRG